MSPEENIILGIVSGVITSALLFAIAAFVRGVAIPWYRGIMYRGLDISGAWNGELEYHAVKDNVTIQIEQNENQIVGLVTVVKVRKDESAPKIKTLRLLGTFRDGYLVLMGNNTDRKKQSLMTLLLQSANGGDQLSGMTLLVDSGSGHINAREIILSRAVNT